MTPLFIATERFGPTDGDAWRGYCRFAKIPHLIEVVSLDQCLCPPLVREFTPEDWDRMVNLDFCLGYFYDLDYLLKRAAAHSRPPY